MDAIFWAALGFLVAVIVVGSAFVAVRAWRAWQACVSLAVVAAATLDLLAARGERAAAKAERIAVRSEELLAAVARLERSTARGRVLLGAAGEMVGVVRAVAAFVPRA
jgi:hypothetical protein